MSNLENVISRTMSDNCPKPKIIPILSPLNFDTGKISSGFLCHVQILALLPRESFFGKTPREFSISNFIIV